MGKLTLMTDYTYDMTDLKILKKLVGWFDDGNFFRNLC
jgi:hypothetical protein